MTATMFVRSTSYDLERYVGQLADLLRLRDWEFSVSPNVPEDRDALASIQMCPGQYRATLAFAPEFFEDSVEEQRATILHELIHCHLRKVDDGFARLIETAESGIGAIRLLRGVAAEELEFATEALSQAIAPFFPLPEDLPDDHGART